MERGSLNRAREVAARLIANVGRVIVGKHQTVRLGVMALLCRGHVLIEGAPGVGKTVLAHSLALSMGGTFRRIQCTSDLLPSDVTGTYVFNQRDRDFYFRPGPLMANMVLVDEVNRASPRTQSAFLECMEERQVTVDGVTHRMPEPFILLATRNPTEHGGTFPLPVTELDRFLLRLRLDYPSHEEEVLVVEQQLLAHPIESLGQVVSQEEVMEAQAAVRRMYVDRQVMDYVVSVVNRGRNHPHVYGGVSPRGTLALVGLAQARALVEERDFTLPDDVKAVAAAALGHRLSLTAEGRTSTSEDDVIQEILDSVPVEGRGEVERASSAAYGSE